MGAMQTRLIAVAVVVLLLIGGGVFVLNSKNSKSKQASVSPSPSTSPQANSGGQTMAELFTMGGNKKCTFQTDTSTGGSTKGTMYVSNTNVRGDIVMTQSNGKIENSHIVRVGDENYIWGDSFPGGIKMKLSVADLSKNSQTSGTINTDQKANFNCSAWNADNTMFTPPTNIKFTDMSSVVAPSGLPATSSVPNPNSAQCSACNSLTGTAKTACLSSLNCQ